jgi:HlyD family secretion protein
MNKRLILRITAVLGILSLAALAYIFWWRPLQHPATLDKAFLNPSPSRYQTVPVRKGDLTATIGTTGAVRSSQSAVLLWQTSGTVSSVKASAGQFVKAKTVLAALEQTSLLQTVIMAQADLVNAQKSLDTLMQSTQARANTQMAMVKTQKELEDALKDRKSLLFQRASPEQIDISRARLITAKDALSQAEKFYDTHNGNPESVTYAVALDQLAKARQLEDQADYNLQYVAGLPEPLDIEEADARIGVAQANVLQAKLDWDRVKDGPNDQDVAAAEARVTAAQAALNLARIAAPFDGTLTLANSKVGDQAAPGVVAFQLDDLSHLYVDLAVAEVDIAPVQVGQPAVITLDALPGKEYSAAVTEIGAVGKNIGGTVNFTVTIEITDPGKEVKPGMTVTAAIAVSQARNSLLVPTRAIRALNGQRVIYLIKDGAPVRVTITTGPASGEDTTVVGGAIQEGDLVILNTSGIE